MDKYTCRLSELEIKYAIQDWLLKTKGLEIENHPGNMRNPKIKLSHKETTDIRDKSLFADCKLVT